MDTLEKITILIADDHSLVRKGIISMFNANEGIEFVDEASNGEELIEKYQITNPDLILVDISMPGIGGIEAVKILIEKGFNPKALFLTMDSYDENKYRCYTLGGMGLVGKDASKEELLKAICLIHWGKKYFGPDWNDKKLEELAQKYGTNFNKDRFENTSVFLTRREKVILTFIGEGFSSNQIADKLCLGKRTIDSYRRSLLRKLNLNSLSELIIYATKNYRNLSTS